MSELGGEEWLEQQSELEVVFSLMSDKELMEMKEKIEEMIKGGVYGKEGFPLSCADLRWLIATIMFSFWIRKGKGVRLVEGEVVVCEREESPFWKRHHSKREMEEKLKEEVEVEEVKGGEEWV